MEQRRVAALAALLAATVTTGAAYARTAPPRTETRTTSYVLPSYDSNQTVLGTIHIGGGSWVPPAWARYVTVVVHDDAGLSVAFHVDETTYSGNLPRGAYCTKTPGAIAIHPPQETIVTLYQGPCPDGTLGAGTKGTITVVFRDRR